MTSENITLKLKNKIIDINDLKVASLDGIPARNRALCYRIFLGIVGLNSAKIEEEIQEKKYRYVKYIVDLCEQNSSNFSNDHSGEWNGKYKCQELAGQDIGECNRDIKVNERNITNCNDKDGVQNKRNMTNCNTNHCYTSYTNTVSRHVNIKDPQNDISTATSDISMLLKSPYNTKYYTAHISKLISAKTVHQILIDIKRIDKASKTFESTDISHMYANILTLVAYNRPTLGYIQGMADILIPFIHIYSEENIETAESSAYYTYLRILDKIQSDIITLQYSQLFRLNQMLSLIDPTFYNYLKDQKLEIHIFAFRWFNCLFVREFSLKIVLRLLDSFLLFDDLSVSLVAFAAALLMFFKEKLMASDFGDNVLFLQSLQEVAWCEEDVEILLMTAGVYKRMFLEKHIQGPG